MSRYVKENLNNHSIIYVEQSSDKGFKGQNHDKQMKLIKTWKTVFNTTSLRSRVKFILSTSSYYYFEDTISVYTGTELKEFDAYSISGFLGTFLPYTDNYYDVTQVNNLTTQSILDSVIQSIQDRDEIDFIYQMNKVAMKYKIPLIAYNLEFGINAPSYQNRAKMAWGNVSLIPLEVQLENLIIDALRQPLVEQILLDFFGRWWKIGGGLMFMSNIVATINQCETGGHVCGYKSVMENLIQDPMQGILNALKEK